MSKGKTLRVVCAWCGKVIKRGNSDEVSHGICTKCADTVIKGQRRNRETRPDYPPDRNAKK